MTGDQLTKGLENTNREASDKAQPKLCIDVIADAWGKNHATDPSIYKQHYASRLNKEGVSQLDLDRAWEEHMLDVETEQKGLVEATRDLARLKLNQGCK